MNILAHINLLNFICYSITLLCNHLLCNLYVLSLLKENWFFFISIIFLLYIFLYLGDKKEWHLCVPRSGGFKFGFTAAWPCKSHSIFNGHWLTGHRLTESCLNTSVKSSLIFSFFSSSFTFFFFWSYSFTLFEFEWTIKHACFTS